MRSTLFTLALLALCGARAVRGNTFFVWTGSECQDGPPDMVVPAGRCQRESLIFMEGNCESMTFALSRLGCGERSSESRTVTAISSSSCTHAALDGHTFSIRALCSSKSKPASPSDATARRGATCPTECISCSGGMLSCSFLSITAIPLIPAGITSAMLFNNLITSVIPSPFALVNSSLLNLELSANLITYIAPTSFAGLTVLQELLLNGNMISYLPPTLLQGLTALQRCDLGSNQITSVPSEFFASQTHSLLTLNMHVNNLTAMPSTATAVLSSLIHLDVSGNAIAALFSDSIAGLPALQSLNLSYNMLTSLPQGVFSTAFSSTQLNLEWSPWYYAMLQFPFESTQLTPAISLAGNPLQYLSSGVFSGLPSNIFVMLSQPSYGEDMSSPYIMNMSSCCGLEWLVNNNGQILWEPGTVTCRDETNRSRSIESLGGRIICPCLNETGNIRRSSQVACAAVNNRRLIDRDCVVADVCPPGQRSVAIVVNVTLPGVSCVYYDIDRGTDIWTFLIETKCEECFTFNCLSCPGTADKCVACVAPYVLLENTCVPSCGPGFVNMSGTCSACEQAVCSACSPDPSSCTQCNSTRYQLLRGLCVGCTDPSCIDCTTDFSSCAACAPGTFLLPSGMCGSRCPPGYQVDGTACSAVQSTSSSTSPGVIAGVVIGSAFGVAIIAAIWLRCTRRRFLQTEIELRERLMSSAQQVEALRSAWNISPTELIMGEVIGYGSGGKVVEGVWRGVRVVVKTLRSASHLVEISEDFRKEIGVMRTIRHPNIVLFFGAGSTTDSMPFLVTELVELGNLRRYLENNPLLPWAQKINFALDVSRGMGYLHRLHKIHRDLKSGNLLVSASRRVKVADFGMAAITRQVTKRPQGQYHHLQWRRSTPAGQPEITDLDAGDLRTRGVGTPRWMAPELLKGSAVYGPEVDVYSFGIVMWEIASQRLPWEDLKAKFFMATLLNKLEAGERPECEAGWPVTYTLLMQTCWATLPADRPGFERAIKVLDDLAKASSA
eukprot:m.92505 g.92505  ORF g.92505 m.92505 type:complete len:1008 (+) comp8513_c0_seq1:46-3069(+)